MAVPIVLAETIAVTELYILYTRDYKGPVRQLNRVCSIVVGLYFAGVFFYLLRNAVMPITAQSAWYRAAAWPHFGRPQHHRA